MITNQLLQYLGGDLASYDFHKELKKITASTLLLYGSFDPLLNFSGKKLDESIPDSKLVVIDKSGHFPFIEQKKRFNKEVSAFLEK